MGKAGFFCWNHPLAAGNLLIASKLIFNCSTNLSLFVESQLLLDSPGRWRNARAFREGRIVMLRQIALCVDADLIELDTCSGRLENEHFDVLTATDIDEGNNLFLRHPVDLVIVGQQHRGTDVELMIAGMKQSKPHIPIMLLSGYDRLSESTLSRIDAFVYQGEPRATFLETVDRLLNLRSTLFSRWIGNRKFSIKATQHHREQPAVKDKSGLTKSMYTVRQSKIMPKWTSHSTDILYVAMVVVSIVGLLYMFYLR
jgi:response regulator RpfG family c-di-GMP phosphodiesterase